jgi:hypothetical protein
MSWKFWFFGKASGNSKSIHNHDTTASKEAAQPMQIVTTLSNEDKTMFKSQHEQVMAKLNEQHIPAPSAQEIADAHHQQKVKTEQLTYENTKNLVKWVQGIVKFFFGFEKLVWGGIMLFSIVMAISFLTQPWNAQTCGAILICALFTLLSAATCFLNVADVKKRINETINITELNTLFGLLATIATMLMLAFATFTIIKDAGEIAAVIIQYGKQILSLF